MTLNSSHNQCIPSLLITVLSFSLLGVARGLLQERLLQFQHGNVRAQKLANPCPTLGQLLASRILYTLLVGEKQHEIAKARFCTQSCSKVGQLLVNSSPTPIPWEVARVFLAEGVFGKFRILLEGFLKALEFQLTKTDPVFYKHLETALLLRSQFSQPFIHKRTTSPVWNL